MQTVVNWLSLSCYLTVDSGSKPGPTTTDQLAKAHAVDQGDHSLIQTRAVPDTIQTVSNPAAYLQPKIRGTLLRISSCRVLLEKIENGQTHSFSPPISDIKEDIETPFLLIRYPHRQAVTGVLHHPLPQFFMPSPVA